MFLSNKLFVLSLLPYKDQSVEGYAFNQVLLKYLIANCSFYKVTKVNCNKILSTSLDINCGGKYAHVNNDNIMFLKSALFLNSTRNFERTIFLIFA